MLSRALIGSLALACSLTAAVAEERPRAFLELFTSQGCAACPAADKIIQKLAERDDVLAVTMPVKLWDFLGWADTLASDDLTKRQMAYSVARGDRDIYTPQMVVNGKEDILGSDEAAIAKAIEAAGGPLPLDISLSISGDILSIDVGDAEIDGDRVTLWLLVVDDEVTVPVGGGENRGRELTYHNVVRSMRPVGMWKGNAMRFDLPLADVEKDTAASCIVIAQVETFKGPGRIVGAAKLAPLFPARVVE